MSETAFVFSLAIALGLAACGFVVNLAEELPVPWWYVALFTLVTSAYLTALNVFKMLLIGSEYYVATFVVWGTLSAIILYLWYKYCRRKRDEREERYETHPEERPNPLLFE